MALSVAVYGCRVRRRRGGAKVATVAPNLPVVGDEADAALLRQLPPRRACVDGCASAGVWYTNPKAH